MAYTNAEGRQELLDELEAAVDAIAIAVAELGEAYELLDENTADKLEEVLFRPATHANGRGKRTYTEFAQRHGFPPKQFPPGDTKHANGARGHIDHAIEAIEGADHLLADLQDGMLPVEVGDAEVRAGIAETRTLLGPLPGVARRLESLLGR